MNQTLSILDSFFQQGGMVLYLIFVTSLALWTLIVERFYFYRRIYKTQVAGWYEQWQDLLISLLPNQKPNVKMNKSETVMDVELQYRLRCVRRSMVSSANLELKKHVSTIKALIAICPLIGLLGTVTGMIEVFDVIAGSGGSDARAVAAGVSMATIPTMAGMVIAISGFYFANSFQQTVKTETAKLLDLLKTP